MRVKYVLSYLDCEFSPCSWWGTVQDGGSVKIRGIRGTRPMFISGDWLPRNRRRVLPGLQRAWCNGMIQVGVNDYGSLGWLVVIVFWPLTIYLLTHRPVNLHGGSILRFYDTFNDVLFLIQHILAWCRIYASQKTVRIYKVAHISVV